MAQPALFRRSYLHLASLHLASLHGSRAVLLGFAASLMLAGGCDNSTHSADRVVGEKLKDAQTKIALAKAPPTASNSDLSAASMDTTASPTMQIHAKVAFADSEFNLAQLLANQVQENDVQIDRLSHEIGLLANEIQSNNLLVASLQEYDPTGKSKKVMDDVTTAQEQVTNGTDGAWIKSDTTNIASLASVDKQRDALQAEITRLTDEIKTNTDERTKLLDSADKQAQESDHPAPLPDNAALNDRLAQREKTADLFKQASDSREKAAELTVKIDSDSAKLARNQADLAVQQALHDSLSATVAALKTKGQSVTTTWSAVQEQITKLNGESAKLLGDNPVNPPKPDSHGYIATDETIGSKARAIADLADLSVKPRAEALDHFNKAIQLYGNAAGLARTFGVDLGTRMSQADQLKPEQVAWKAEKAALDPNIFLFQEGDAELLKANLLARSAAQATMRLNQITALKPIIEAAGLQSLPTLSDTDKTLVSQKNDAGTVAATGAGGGSDAGARGSFNKASALLETVYNSTAPLEVRSAAKVEQIYLQYSWASLESTAGDVQMAARHMSSAREEAAAAATAGIPVPPLPAEPTPASASPGAGATGEPQFAPPTGNALKLVGTYKGTDPAPTGGTIATVMVLKPDGTVTVDGTISDGKAGSQPMLLKVTGKWMMLPGDKVTVSIGSASMNGIPVPAGSMPNQTMTISSDGKQLVSTDGTGTLVKE